MNRRNLLLSITIVCSTIAYAFANFGDNINGLDNPYSSDYIIAVVQDTIPITERYDNFTNDNNYNPFDLKDPPIIEKEIEYDPESGQYIVYERIGDEYYRNPTYMTFDEFMEYQEEQQERDYFKKLSGLVDADASIGGGITDPIKKLNLDENLLDRLFGGTGITIEPTGKIGLVFGYGYNKTENPAQIQRNQSFGYPIFDMSPLEMNVQGKIGDKLNLDMAYNTAATFNFDNQMKINYSSDEFSEDEIIKKIEAGNVSLPLRSNLIQGSEALFGLKTELQFGRFWLTALASQKSSRQDQISLQNGAQEQEFEIKADEYDQFRHYFLSHFNRDTYEESVKNLPQINTLFQINKIDVWITNDNNNVNDAAREIVALADLGEYKQENITNTNSMYGQPLIAPTRDLCGENVLPDTASNRLYIDLKNDEDAKSLDRAVTTLRNKYGLQQGRDFEKVRARKLNPSEFTYHPQLGFISVNINLRPDQVLGVSYEYVYNGKSYRVGDFASDIPNSGGVIDPLNPEPMPQDSVEQQKVLFVKLLKGTTPRIDLPTWDLMMKNVYSVGAFNVNREDFKLDIFYDDPGQAEKRFLPATNLAEEPLLRVFNLDNLNVQGDPCPDGIFDFVEGVTINTRNGRIMFPVLEPFGDALTSQITDPALAQQYSYTMLYDSTLTRAREYPEFNRYTIRGKYKSEISSEISLGAFNLPPGSVRVTAGRTLIEGEDYEVDYNIGRVRILNEAILNSGTPVNVSFENNSLFGFQQKTMIGLRGEYRFSEDVSIGGTYMHLFERPFTQKVNIGDDPINNKVFGLDFSLTKDAPWLTKAIDALPLIQTKAPSSINFLAEGAYLRPGHAKAINESREDKGGILMVDDFEGSASRVDLRHPANQWFLASTPQNDAENNNPLFPESDLINDPLAGVNRAKLSWYRMEPTFQPQINDQDDDDSYFASIPQTEVFPNLQISPLQQNNTVFSLDLTYYPEERGPYNLERVDGTPYSAGMNNDGTLADPDSRWAGVMREITSNNDFEQSNIEFIEFWVLSPFLEKTGDANISGPGDLYINIGNISEDILRDSRQAFENGLPGVVNNVNRPTRTTSIGRVPELTPVVNGFNQDLEDRAVQDVGLDGFDNNRENVFFDNLLQDYTTSSLSQNAINAILADPSGDDFVHFNDARESGDPAVSANPVLWYKNFNGTEGNSPGSQTGNTRSAATTYPDSEDLNNDKSLNETESYFQYRIPFVPDGSGGVVDNDFVTDVRDGANGRKWYRYKVPLEQFTSKVGGIQDFRSIRFMRMYLKGFDEQVTFRFARLGLGRNQWRTYRRSLETNNISGIDEGAQTLFDVNAINIEENGGRCPFNYVLPPGIQREQSLGAFPNILQNEQSLSMDICDLQDGDARAIYKLLDLDFRVYERLKMFVHAENTAGEANEGKLTAFMRLGSDFEQNYYEYEIPLDFSNPDIIGSCSSNQANSADSAYIAEVWKETNAFDFSLELLKDKKVERNNEGWPLNQLFTTEDPEKPGNKIRVLGNPTMGLVKGVMVGIRNTRDDGATACAEVWINELRVSGLDEKSGGAALARLDMKLADLGDIGASAQWTSKDWGGLEDGVHDRSQEEVFQYEMTAGLELGKVFPEKWGLKVPFLASQTHTMKTPEFDAYDTDVTLKEKLLATAASEQDSVRNQSRDIETIRSYNFTNVRKEKTGDGKPMPWDISNFSLTYARSQTKRSDPIIENEQIDSYQGAVDYNYSMKPLYIEPFKKLVKNKHLKLIGDMNINLIPNKFSFNTIMDRNLTSTSYRFVEGPDYTKQFFNKRFTWDRNYNLDWDITKSLKVRFDASNQAVIDELKNSVFDDSGTYFGERTRDELHAHIWDNIKGFGRTKNYQHAVNGSFTVPFKKIPLLDWVTLKANYSADYNWAASALNTTDIGNVIANGQDRKVNLDFNFESLYKKSKYLDKINNGNKKKARGGSRLNRTTDKKKDSKTDDKKKKKKKVREPTKGEKILIRPLMIVRKAKLSYQETFATVIPGFTPETEFFGLSEGFDAPGWDFVAGWQPRINRLSTNEYNTSKDWLYQAEEKGWLTRSSFLSDEVTQTYNQNINTSLTLEPFNDFKIELQATRQYTENYTETYKDTLKTDAYNAEHLLPRYVGSMNISYSALNTLFRGSDKDILAMFEEFETNRAIISEQLGLLDGNSQGTHTGENEGVYLDGYGGKQLNVLIPAFLAAYTGKKAEDLANFFPTNETNIGEVDLFNLKKNRPRINWNVNYNGLSKIPAMKEIFKSFDLAHSYKSNLVINSFNTDLDYRQGARNPDTDNFFSTFEIPQIGIQEAFSPLIGIGFELQNSLSFDLAYNKSRTLEMRFNDFTLTESRTDEITVGFGYTKEDVYIGFLKNLGRPAGSKKKKKKLDPKIPGVTIGGDKDKDPEEEFSSDLTFQCDLSFRNDASYQHRLDQDSTEPTRGTRDFRITPSIDYDINEQLNVQMYFEYSRIVPKVTTAYPSTTANGGIRILFTL